MKVAVSIPDDIFAETELLVKRLNTSRSELYSRALGEFLGHHVPERLTQLMNEVLGAVGDSTPDAFTKRAGRNVLKRVEW